MARKTKGNHTLYSIPLTRQDIDLITYALRTLEKSTGFASMRDESRELIEYIVDEHKEAKKREGV